MLRKLVLAAGLAGLATAAAAQPPRTDPRYDPRTDPRDEEIARALPAPGQIARAGGQLHRVLDALMDLRVGPLLDAVDPRAGPYRPETLGDLCPHQAPRRRRPRHRGSRRGDARDGDHGAGAAAQPRERHPPRRRRRAWRAPAAGLVTRKHFVSVRP